MRRLRDEAYVEYRMPGVAVTRVEEPAEATTAADTATAEPEGAGETSDTAAPEEASDTSDTASAVPEEPAVEGTDSEDDSPYVVDNPDAP
jgi:hypothetical protein